MSLRLEMLQVARLASRVLGASAGLVRYYLLRQQNSDGGFKNRAGQSDLYYTVFGVDALAALEAPGPVSDHGYAERAAEFARSFGDGEGLDFVHLCCLARALGQLRWSWGVDAKREASTDGILRRIEKFRSGDGGYHATAASNTGTVYGCFLALGAYQDLLESLPDHPGLLRCLAALATPDGAWSNIGIQAVAGEAGVASGSTNATAAAIAVLRQLGQPVPGSAAAWLLARLHSQGGFRASPEAPLPDLLSTATALHALAGMQAPLDGLRERCLDFLDSLWTNEGSFHAHWAEDTLDCEYTFYGLLALGHLGAGSPAQA